jgi:hypothetical protein
MATPAERLEVRRIERRAPERDLDDVVDLEGGDPVSVPARPAPESVAVERVRPRRVPEVATLESPLAQARAVRRPTRGEADRAAHAAPGTTRLAFEARALGEPPGRVTEDPDRTRGGTRRHTASSSGEVEKRCVPWESRTAGGPPFRRRPAIRTSPESPLPGEVLCEGLGEHEAAGPTLSSLRRKRYLRCAGPVGR